MGLIYAFSTQHDFWYLAIIAGVFHLFVDVLMIVLGRKDPGIIQKVYQYY